MYHPIPNIFDKDKKVLVQQVNNDICEAKVLECKSMRYKVHYIGWNKR